MFNRIKQELDDKLANTPPGTVCQACYKTFDREPKKHKDDCPVVLKAQLAALKKLVREMGEALNKLNPRCNHPINDRPEVRAILEEKK